MKHTNKNSKLTQYGPSSQCHAVMFRGRTGKHLKAKNLSNYSLISPALSRKAQIPPRCSPGRISFQLFHTTAIDLLNPTWLAQPPVLLFEPRKFTLSAPLPEPFVRPFDNLGEPLPFDVHLVSTCLDSQFSRGRDVPKFWFPGILGLWEVLFAIAGFQEG